MIRLRLSGHLSTLSPPDIKAAYWKLARVYHPDKGHKDAVTAFPRIRDAYEKLMRMKGAPV